MSTKRSLAILTLVCFLVYLPSFWNQFVWDDEQFIYRNRYVLEFNLPAILTENTIAGAGEVSNYYRPLTTFTFALDHALWGLQPFGFHLTNTALHIFAGLLTFLLLRELGLKRVAFWIAALFLLHPLQTESVTYVNSRGDSLYAALVLLSLYAFTLAIHKKHFTLHLSDRTLKISTTHLLSLSVITYVLSLFSKEIAIAAVGIHTVLLGRNLLLSKLPLKQWLQQQQATIIAWIGLASSAALYLLARATVLNFNNSFNFYGYENEYTSSLVIRLLTFSKSLWWYWRWLLVPYPLHMERDMPLVTSLTSPWPWLSLAVIAALGVIGLLEWKKRKSVWIWFGSLWFFIWMSPMSGIIPINGILYEHWLYVPMIGFWLVLYGGWILLKRRVPEKVLSYAVTLLLVVASLLTIRQNYIWRAPIPFYEYTLQYANTARLHNNLAMAYSDAGLHQQAIEEYQAALQISNVYPQIYYNLGNSYLEIGDTTQAEQAFQSALALNSNFEHAYGPLINLYLSQERYGEALPLISKMLEIYPTHSDLWLLHGMALFNQDKIEEAEASFTKARTYSLQALYTSQLIDSIKTKKE